MQHKDNDVVTDYFERSVKEWEQVHSLEPSVIGYFKVMEHVSQICGSTPPSQKLRPITEQALTTFFLPLSDNATCKDTKFREGDILQQYAKHAYAEWIQTNPDQNTDVPDIRKLCIYGEDTSPIKQTVFAYMDKNGKPQAEYGQAKAQEAKYKKNEEYHKAKKSADEAAFKRGVELMETINGGKEIKRCWDC